MGVLLKAAGAQGKEGLLRSEGLLGAQVSYYKKTATAQGSQGPPGLRGSLGSEGPQGLLGSQPWSTRIIRSARITRIAKITRSAKITRTARGASELLLKPAGAQGSQGPLESQGLLGGSY